VAFEPVFGHRAAPGFMGWVGLEYVPSDASDSAGSFGWL